jgi:antitoxin HicB
MQRVMSSVQEGEETKSVEDYLNLPYTMEVVPVDGHYLGRVQELPDCYAWANSFAELEGEIEGAKRMWIEEALEQGRVVPEPRPDREFSGKLLTRMPRTLHRLLTYEAEREGVSINQYIVAKLANKVGDF